MLHYRLYCLDASIHTSTHMPDMTSDRLRCAGIGCCCLTLCPLCTCRVKRGNLELVLLARPMLAFPVISVPENGKVRMGLASETNFSYSQAA